MKDKEQKIWYRK